MMERLKQINLKTVLMVFVLSVLTECAYTGYAYFVARGDVLRGPLFAGLIAIGKGILVYTYTRKPIQIATLAVGQVIGTYLTLNIIGSLSV
jgi:hypothetical protein